MDQDRSGSAWIAEFLEWTFNEGSRSADEPVAYDALIASEAEDGIAGAYLEWIDAPALDTAREGVLLMALRTEADCVHMLRQVLETDGAAPDQLRLAIEGLEDAQRLLEGEQRAWHALLDVREAGWTTPERIWSSGFEQEWPGALENVAAEVHALAGKVLAMHPH
jgi:hypothetical protein